MFMEEIGSLAQYLGAPNKEQLLKAKEEIQVEVISGLRKSISSCDDLVTFINALDIKLEWSNMNGQIKNDDLDIDEIIRRIDAKIAELEAESNSNKSSRTKKKSDAKKPLDKSIEHTSNVSGLYGIDIPTDDSSHFYWRSYFLYTLVELSKMESNQSDMEIATSLIKELQNGSVNGRFFYAIIHAILVSTSIDTCKSIMRSTKDSICKQFEELLKHKEKFSVDEFDRFAYLKTALIVCVAVIRLCNDEGKKSYTAESVLRETNSIINSKLAYTLCDSKDEAEVKASINLAKNGLYLSDPYDRYQAYNALGYSTANSNGNLQLSYDAFYSWLNQKPYGDIVSLLENDAFDQLISKESEVEWRKRNPESLGCIYTNIAYVCACISDTYELYSKQWERFKDKAISYIREASRIRRKPSEEFLSEAVILLENVRPDGNYDTILKECAEYLTAEDKKALLEDEKALLDIGIDLSKRWLLSKFILEFSDKSKGKYIIWKSKPISRKVESKLNEALSQSLCNEVYKNLSEWQKRLNSFNATQSDKAENDLGHLEDLIKRAEIPADKYQKINLALMLIDCSKYEILRLLRRREYFTTAFKMRDESDESISARESVKPVAYYTTLKTAKYLFDVKFRKDSSATPYTVSKGNVEYDKGINCLTLMQPIYMNDPYEGLMFEQCISNGMPNKNPIFYMGDAIRFRQDVYNEKNIFIKSFTDRPDDLIMWNRYASDRKDGAGDSNGCYIQFDAELFDVFSKRGEYEKRQEQKSESVNQNVSSEQEKKIEDDYSLYSVIYCDKDTNGSYRIDTRNNTNIRHTLKDISDCLDVLTLLIQWLNNVCLSDGKVSKEIVNEIRNCVRRRLGRLVFLFKDVIYKDEHEYRIIACRDHSRQDSINVIDAEVPMLSINPYFQVCIEKIILGPSVENSERWESYLQYQVRKMRKRAFGNGEFGEKIDNFIIEKSTLHYLTKK